MTRGQGDCNVVKSRNGSIQADFLAWKVKFLNRLKALAKGEKKSCSGNCKREGSCRTRRREEQEARSHSSEVTARSSEAPPGLMRALHHSIY